MHLIDSLLIAGYFVLILALGLRAGRKVNDMRQFSIAGGRYGALVVFATLSASYIGGGFTMGNAATVYLIGVANVVAIWGFSIKEIFVALFIAPRMRHFPNALSAGDITGEAYGKPGKVLTGVFGMLLCIAIVGAQVGAMGAVFKVFLGMSPLVGIVLGCGLLIIYSTFGGMRAVVLTDVVQFALLFFGLPLVLVLGVIAVGGPARVIEAVPAGHWDLFSEMRPIAFVSLFLVFMFGEALVPPYLQRLMIGSPKNVGRGTLWSGIMSIPFFLITGLIGLVALAMTTDLESANLAIPFVVAEAVPIGLKGIVVAGILSVSMSSADSFLNSAAVAFSHDVVKPLRSRNPLSPSAELTLARFTTAFGGIGAVIVAISIEGLLEILFYAYNFWAPVVLVPLIAALFGFRTHWKYFFAAAGAGVAANLIWAWGLESPGGVDGLLLGILANAVVLWASPRSPARETQS